MTIGIKFNLEKIRDIYTTRLGSISSQANVGWEFWQLGCKAGCILILDPPTAVLKVQITEPPSSVELGNCTASCCCYQA